jgi:hypothetical protein
MTDKTSSVHKLNGSSPHTLEERIVAALQDPAISASELTALIADTECGLVDAVQIAERMHEVAVDPLQSADATKAQEAAQLAQLIVKRLETVLPRLHAKHQQAVSQHRRAKWTEAADLMQRNRDFLAKEFAELVPQWTSKLLELFQRVYVMNAEIQNLNGVAPNAESRRLESLGYQQLLASTKLLGLAGETLWPPPPAPILPHQVMPIPSHPGGNWAQALEQRERERHAEGRRVAAYYKNQQEQREQREAAEAKATRNGAAP